MLDSGANGNTLTNNGTAAFSATVPFANYLALVAGGGFFNFFFGPSTSNIIVHKPIPTAGLTENDLVSLKTKVYETISKELERYENR